jgi:uncharacterized protein (DUF58 family)
MPDRGVSLQRLRLYAADPTGLTRNLADLGVLGSVEVRPSPDGSARLEADLRVPSSNDIVTLN